MPEQFFNKIVVSAREAVSGIEDIRKSAVALSKVAALSSDPADFQQISEITANNGCLQDEVISAMAVIFAEAGKLDQARELANKAKSAFWKTEALSFIALLSNDDKDYSLARQSASEINAISLREPGQIFPDIAGFAYQRRETKRAQVVAELSAQTLADFVKVLVRTVGLENAFKVLNQTKDLCFQVNALLVLAELEQKE